MSASPPGCPGTAVGRVSPRPLPPRSGSPLLVAVGRGGYFFAAPEPILNILVPQVGQTPCVAGRPFFMVTWVGFFISRVALHFMQ